jgi:DNA-binding GntR family transcriptional regulator
MARRDNTIADGIFDQIVSDILSGRIRPNVELTEHDLVTRFGASRTPVREAIKRLRERGFLTVGRKGVGIVRSMSRQEVEELYALRLRLERVAALLTARNITAGEIADLKRINQEFARAAAAHDLVPMLDVRAQFHAVLVTATRNPWLADLLIMLRDYAYPVRHVHWQDPDRAARTIGLHDDMIQCLEQHDTKGFRQLVVRQIGDALEVFRNRPPSPPT